MSLFGVMDGHGEFGHLVADYVKVNFPMLFEQESIRADPCASILSAMKKLCANLQTTGINVNFSGTTAIIGLKVDDMMYIANIGDSRCVLARKSQTGDYIEAVPLSTDHKPDVPTEKARILAAGGRVCPLPGPEDEDRGPDRVWLEKVDVPGLAMSRSIGDDISQQVGVISVPEITQYRISRNDLFVVWASDGVWEFVSNEDAVATVAQHLPNLGDATRALVSLSTQRWKMNEEVIDDITTVIVQF
jgi:serine/threonine protein phosphatase PrpC